MNDRAFYHMLLVQEVTMWRLLNKKEGHIVSEDEFNFLCERRSFNSEERKLLLGALEKENLKWKEN